MEVVAVIERSAVVRQILCGLCGLCGKIFGLKTGERPAWAALLFCVFAES